MIKTSTCPNCQQPVALVNAPETSLVACPHCHEQFELTRFLDFVAEAESGDAPPELVLVELRDSEDLFEQWATPDEAFADEDLADFQPIGEEPESNEPELAWEEEPSAESLPVGESADAESGEDEPDQKETEGEDSSEEELDEEESDDLVLADDDGEGEDTGPEEAPLQVRCPCCHGSFALENLLLAQTDEPIGSDAAAAILGDGTVRKEAVPGFHFGGAVADEDHSGFRLASVEPRPSASPASFEFASPVGSDAEGSDEGESGRARRRRRERGGMKDMLGAIFGGAAGLLITYYLLNLFGGSRFDMLHVYLPGVSHTAVHRPGWLGGPPEEEPFDSGIGSALEVEAETPKPAPREPKTETTPSADAVVELPDMPAEEPPATEEKLPEDYVGVLNPPQVTADDLGRALREVDQLAEAGDFGEEAYEAWCRAAVAATFLERNDGEPQTANRLDALRTLMKEIAGADIPKIGQFATARTTNPDRPNHGILLAGIASKPNTPKGNGYMTGLQVAGTGVQIVIASDRRLPIQPGDRVLVLGYLVDQPKETTQGLETELPQVTWVRTVLKFQD